MKGINNTIYVQKLLGERLQMARNARGYKRTEFADKLSKNKNAPIERGVKGHITMERLKQWEYGANPISLEWIPAICDELSIDVGYLFGEYKEHKRIFADVFKETGLNEAAVENMKYLKALNQGYLDVLSILISDSNIEYLLYLIETRFLKTMKPVVAPKITQTSGGAILHNAQEWHNYINDSTLDIKMDGGIIHVKKTNLLDSLIGNTLTEKMGEMSLAYQKNFKSGGSDNG